MLNRVNWEFLKYEIRKFSISVCKILGKEVIFKGAELENKIKPLEKNLALNNNFE